MKKVKSQLSYILNSDKDFCEPALDHNSMFHGFPIHYLQNLGLNKIGNPTEHARRIYEAIKQSTALLSVTNMFSVCTNGTNARKQQQIPKFGENLQIME